MHTITDKSSSSTWGLVWCVFAVEHNTAEFFQVGSLLHPVTFFRNQLKKEFGQDSCIQA
ncbi:unnamed protein product, partial [Amoebophrya sp. A120]